MNCAIVLAGGRGVRFGNGELPKQFIELASIPMVVRSMRTAQINEHIDAICVVAAEEYHQQIMLWAEEYNITKLRWIALAGKERYESVYNGLTILPLSRSDVVIILTSVCPLVSQMTLNKHFMEIDRYDGVITVVKATDAITFSSDGKRANRTLQKSRIFVQQGPQTYRYGILRDAHEAYLASADRKEIYEDSELVMDLGVDVKMVLGDRFCIKVTYPEDLAIVEALIPLFEKKEQQAFNTK